MLCHERLILALTLTLGHSQGHHRNANIQSLKQFSPSGTGKAVAVINVETEPTLFPIFEERISHLQPAVVAIRMSKWRWQCYIPYCACTHAS